MLLESQTNCRVELSDLFFEIMVFVNICPNVLRALLEPIWILFQPTHTFDELIKRIVRDSSTRVAFNVAIGINIQGDNRYTVFPGL